MLSWRPLCRFVLISVVFYHRTRTYDPRLAHRLITRNFGPTVISRKITGSSGLGENLLLSRQFLCTSLSFLCPAGGSFCGTVFRFCWSLCKGITVRSPLRAGDWTYCATLGFGRLRAGRGGSEGSSTSTCLRKAREGLERPIFFATGCISVALSSTDFAGPWV